MFLKQDLDIQLHIFLKVKPFFSEGQPVTQENIQLQEKPIHLIFKIEYGN